MVDVIAFSESVRFEPAPSLRGVVNSKLGDAVVDNSPAVVVVAAGIV